MDPFAAGLITIAFMAVFLGGGIWIFAALMLVALGVAFFVLGYPVDRVGYIMKGILWKSASSWEVAAIPMFILMGDLIYRADIAKRIFRGLAPLVDWLPGRLLHTNILGCTLFAAVSGSSAATTLTIGKITATSLLERKYDSNLSVGSLAGAGSLGLLIPPSIVMILYGVLAEVSIARLFAAGVLPGLMVAALFSFYIGLYSFVRVGTAPAEGQKYSLREKLRAVRDLLPIIALIVVVLGGIYAGYTTPSEAAAVGVAATLVITVLLKEFSLRMLVESLLGTVATSAMICTILVAAAFLSTMVAFAHVPQGLAAAVAGMGLSPYALILILAVFYIILGLFLDGMSITVMTLPITMPLVVQAGWDPIWFGIFLVLMVELAQITPPVGFNLFVLQSLTGWPIGRIARAALPFFFLMCGATLIITIFPGIALWLPSAIWDH